MEGLSIVLCGIWGCCHGLTSYSNNVAVIGLTKVRLGYPRARWYVTLSSRPMLTGFRVNIQFKGHLVSFGYSERIYALCGSEFFKYCPMSNTIN